MKQFAGQNTCAIKLSNAFNNIGYSIPNPRSLPKKIRAVSTSSGNFIFGSTDMGRYLATTFGMSDESYDVTPDNYMSICDILKSKQGLIYMIPSDPSPSGWDAAGHVDVFGTYKGDFDLRSSFQNDGTYQPHMLKYLRDISQRSNHPPGKVSIWHLQGTLPKPSPKTGFWNWLKGLFGF